MTEQRDSRWENVWAWVLPEFWNDIDELTSETIVEMRVEVRTDKIIWWHKHLVSMDDYKEFGWSLLGRIMDEIVNEIDDKMAWYDKIVADCAKYGECVLHGDCPHVRKLLPNRKGEA